MEQIIEQWQQQIAHATRSGGHLDIRGGGSKSFYGQAPVGEPLNTSAYSGIVSYEPSELVVTARAGTPLEELQATLAERGQMLAFEPPHFGPATVGGCQARNTTDHKHQCQTSSHFVLLSPITRTGKPFNH